MSQKKWIVELSLIIAFIFIVNFIVAYIAISESGIIVGQFLNLISFIFFLLWSLYRITSFEKSNISKLIMLFNSKFSIYELFIIIIIYVFGTLSYSYLIEIEIVRHIKIDFYKHFSLNRKMFEDWRMTILILLVLLIIVGVFAEELYFRGYLFDIQYKLYGKYAWIINGISWSIFHIFSNTNIIAILPTALLISYFYKQRRNLRITLGVHLLMNTMAGYNLILKFLN
jgi:membrane protease YdiL (CAAX protease family)